MAAISSEISNLDKISTLVRIKEREAAETGGSSIDSLEMLPEDAKVIVRAMGFTKEQLSGPKEFPLLLNILGFQIQRKLTSAKFPNPYVTPQNDPAGANHYTTDAQDAGRRWVSETVAKSFEKNYTTLAKIGEGGYGTVYKAHVGSDKKKYVAIKKSGHADESERATNLRELYYLMTCNSPYIVDCFECYAITEQKQIWSVLEFMDGGTLTQARKAHKWVPAEVAYISAEMLKGVQYLHSQKIIHRDIKSGNVMFTVDGLVKLIDFGLATNFPEGGQKLKGMIGSPFWMPPEMIRSVIHDHKCDIWSVGMCLFELVLGCIPHNDESKGSSNAQSGPPGARGARAMFLIGTGVLPPYSDPNWPTPDAKNFFDQVFQYEPSKRPEASQLLAHPFLKTAASIDAIKKILVAAFRTAALAMF